MTSSHFIRGSVGKTNSIGSWCAFSSNSSELENKDKAESAYSLVQDMVTANPDLSMVYVTAGGPFGAAKAVKDLNLTGTVGVVGFDHTPDNIQYLKTGEMVGLLDQAPYQQALDSSVMLYNYIVAGQEPPAKIIPVTGKLLTPDDAK